ncbi:MAG: hypothetical protein ACLFUQ_06120 [Candidatus Izemoplasmataceae bacterium]
MEPKIVYWKRYGFNDYGFSLVEIFEDGHLLDRSFKALNDARMMFRETKSETHEIEGEILVERVDFTDEGRLHVHEVDDHAETMKTYPLDDWQKARRDVEKLQDDSINNMRHDYDSLIQIKKSTLPEHLQSVVEGDHFPIVKFRYEKEGKTLIRKRYPERLEIRFVPEINERLYFDLLTETNHLTTTGDNIFAIHTQDCEKDFCVTDFEDYIATMLKKISDNPDHYHDLILKQRERRVKIDTEEMGDLYPR